ncbi:hypothetical protein CAPTEDRAFT_217778 [Capitella teleta]|uniref:Uncharacterized protein n=1 Tax=Capitella teleta TaxID=283909 RepID=R7U9F6_CAPTE|nr:hypothetical protein CAPTEDRAFT_217778 [Capitella teleta]|eukprot:ELU02624.1 hypothetical protein CAPTEDRAFT_217778 [Capitella teleta]
MGFYGSTQPIRVIRTPAIWYNQGIHEERRARRRMERKYYKTKLVVHKQMLQEQNMRVIELIRQRKKDYFKEMVDVANNKEVFKLVNSLLTLELGTFLPTNAHMELLPKLFSDFFQDKVLKICEELNSTENSLDEHVGTDEESEQAHTLGSFNSFTKEEIGVIIITQSPCKTCLLDCILTQFLQQPPVLAVLLPQITTLELRWSALI